MCRGPLPHFYGWTFPFQTLSFLSFFTRWVHKVKLIWRLRFPLHVESSALVLLSSVMSDDVRWCNTTFIRSPEPQWRLSNVSAWQLFFFVWQLNVSLRVKRHGNLLTFIIAQQCVALAFLSTCIMRHASTSMLLLLHLSCNFCRMLLIFANYTVWCVHY